jgi:hypothetical protein
MAQAMNLDIGSQLALVGQQLHNLFEILGELLLPVVSPLIRGLSGAVTALQRMAKTAPGLTRVVLVLAAAMGLVLVAVGGVIAAAGAVGLLLPAVKAGLIAMSGAIAAVGGAVSMYLLPVTAIITGIVAAVALLRRAWQTNFGGIQDFIMGAYTRIKLVFRGIGALIASLSGGTGKISAELANKLKALGLWNFVKTVFMVYYRVRQFLTGLWTAVSTAFRKIAGVLGPPIRTLLGALGALGRAFLSVLEALGLVSTAAGGSAFQSLGSVLGTLLGIVAQVASYVLRFIVTPLAWVLHVVALVVRAGAWLFGVFARGAVAMGKFLYTVLLPLRLIGAAVVAVAKIAHALWQVLSGDLSVLGGLKTIGGAIAEFLATPFLWVRDVALGFWKLVESLFGGLAAFFRGAGAALVSAILDLPLVRTLRGIWRNLRAFFTGDKTFFQAGKGILLAIGKGILSAITWPYRLIKRAFGWIARLLPFSDAQEGPLSRLTHAGRALIQTLCNGILSLATLPLRIIAGLFRGILNVAAAIWRGVKRVVRAGWELVKGLAGFAVDVLTAPFRLALAAGRAIWSGVKGVAQAGWAAAKSVGAAVWSGVSAPFRWVGSAASAAWSGVKGAASSAWQGMKALGGAGWRALAAPFSRLRDAASGAWDSIAATASAAWDGVQSAASAGLQGVKSVASSAYEAGKSVVNTVAEGAKSVVTAPYKAAKTAFGFVRSLLPFSDAEEGPLSDLTAAGRSLLETFARGMASVADLPAKMFQRVWGFLGDGLGAGGPAGWLGGLAGALLGPTGSVAASAERPVPSVIREREVERTRLLAERVTTLAPAPGAASGAAGPGPLEALLAKLDELGNRPVEVDVTVVSKLDGRTVAQAVYRDIRREKVKNYETL